MSPQDSETNCDRSVKPPPELVNDIRDYIKRRAKEFPLLQEFHPQFTGKETFAFVPTGGNLKKEVVAEASGLRVVGVELSTGINEPIDTLGRHSAAERLKLSLFLIQAFIPFFDHACLGGIKIYVIENFLQRGEVTVNDITYPAVDYGIWIRYDVFTGDLDVTVSNGAPVEQEVLDFIEKHGYADEKKLNAHMTPGDAFHELHGWDTKDWHKNRCGKSRYMLLLEAIPI